MSTQLITTLIYLLPKIFNYYPTWFSIFVFPTRTRLATQWALRKEYEELIDYCISTSIHLEDALDFINLPTQWTTFVRSSLHFPETHSISPMLPPFDGHRQLQGWYMKNGHRHMKGRQVQGWSITIGHR